MPQSKLKDVLLIDDDFALASMLKKYVEKYGYRLLHAATAQAGLKELERAEPMAILLDLNLPGSSGLDLCREIRSRKSVPILIVSALGETADRILGLETGADDYLAKPFDPRELVARLSALDRRVERLSTPPSRQVLQLGELEVDVGKHKVTLAGASIELSSAEFALLCVFAAEPGHVFDRDELLNRLKGIDWDAYNRSVDVLVSRLRKKLGDTPRNARFLKTVWGSGYVFLPQDPARKTG